MQCRVPGFVGTDMFRKTPFKASIAVAVSWVVFASAQPKTQAWKEYVFPDDGFAITLPQAPNPHADSALPEFTVYSISLQPTVRLSLRASHQNRDCAATLAQLEDGALKGKSGITPSSVKHPSAEGGQGLEYEYEGGPERISSDRFYCVNGKFYAFSSNWPRTQSRPTALTRAINSFRLLNGKSR